MLEAFGTIETFGAFGSLNKFWHWRRLVGPILKQKCFLTGPIPASFWFFSFFSTTNSTENCRLQRDSNSDHRSRKRARCLPLDHHHGPWSKKFYNMFSWKGFSAQLNCPHWRIGNIEIKKLSSLTPLNNFLIQKYKQRIFKVGFYLGRLHSWVV